MIVKTKFFDDYVAATIAGCTPTMPMVARSYTVKGYSLHVEKSLIEEAKVLRKMARLEQPDVRFFHPNAPAKRIKDSLCIISMLVHGRVVDMFCAEVSGGMVVIALYCDAVAAFRVIDKVRGTDKD